MIAGVSDNPPRLATEPPLPLLLGYAVASTLYRWLVIAGILWILYVALAPHGLTVLAGLLAIVVVGTAVTTPLIPLCRFLGDPGRRATVQIPRLVAWLAALILCGIALFFTPLPYRPAVPVILRAQNASRVYVTTPGILEAGVRPGTTVTADQQLAQLGNHDLEFEVVTLTARRNQQRLHLEQLRLRRHDVPSLGNQLPAAEKVLADLEQQLIQRDRELQRLALVSPVAGTVIPPRSRPPQRTPGELASYAGTPLDEANLGCYLETGTLFCLVGDPQRTEAVALVDESIAPHVRPGQHARIQFNEAPGTYVSGHVVRISQLSASDLPPELLAAGEIALEKGVGSVRPQGNYYEAVIELQSPATPLLMHAPGKAAIEVDPQPLSARLYRSIRSVFRLP